MLPLLSTTMPWGEPADPVIVTVGFPLPLLPAGATVTISTFPPKHSDEGIYRSPFASIAMPSEKSGTHNVPQLIRRVTSPSLPMGYTQISGTAPVGLDWVHAQSLRPGIGVGPGLGNCL